MKVIRQYFILNAYETCTIDNQWYIEHDKKLLSWVQLIDVILVTIVANNDSTLILECAHNVDNVWWDATKVTMSQSAIDKHLNKNQKIKIKNDKTEMILMIVASQKNNKIPYIA